MDDIIEPNAEPFSWVKASDLDAVRSALLEHQSDANPVTVIVRGDDLVQLVDDLAAERARNDRLAENIIALQDHAAGTARELDAGVTLREQHMAVHDALVAVRESVLVQQLRGVTLIWEEGKGVLLMTKVVALVASPEPSIIVPG